MLVILGMQLAVQALIGGSVLFFLGYDVYSDLFIIIVDLPAFIVFLYVSSRRDMRDVFTTLITIFINITISIPAAWISQLLEGGYGWYNLIRVILFIFVLFVLHFFIRRRYLELQDVLEKGWGIFSIQPAIGLILIYYQYIQYGIEEVSMPMLLNCSMLFVLIFIVFWVLYYVFKQLHEKHLIQEQQRFLAIQNKVQLHQFQQQKEMSEMTNRRWHDLRHSMQELIDMLEAGDMDTAMAYLKEQRGMADVPKANYCLHPAVNSIICLWAERCRRQDIEVELCMDVPEQLEIEPLELSALFANAFENAYEACLRLPDDAVRFIKAEARYNGKLLAVGFTNSCIGDIKFENGLPVSGKNGGGVGTRSMSYTVHRLHGNISFSAKGTTFTVRFTLKI